MTKEDLDYILKKNRWRFRHSHFYKHYFFYVPAVLLSAIVLPGLPAVVLVALVTYITINRIKQYYTFKVVENQYSRRENAERIINAFEALSHRIIESENTHVRVKTAISPSSWGEYITAIPLENKILINSWPVHPPLLRKNIENLKVVEEYINREDEELVRV